ncbi:MAG: 50S ribosomal protein L17 [Planctomycetaceae bacterium]
MRHRETKGKLTVTPAHQRAMGRNLVGSLFQSGQVVTTLAKAKAFRPFAERLITLARRGNRSKAEGTPAGAAAYLHCVRRAAQLMPHRPSVRRLFREVAPAVGDRPGGYTRILRLAKPRLGDNAPRALLMLVDRPGAQAAEASPEEKAGEIKPAKGKAKEAAPRAKPAGKRAERR